LVSNVEEHMSDTCDEKDYILIYGYTNRFTLDEGKSIKEYAGKQGKKLIALGGKQTFCDHNVVCRPMEVLGYFKNADLIITDTFHGTIFSVLAENNFVTIIRAGEGGNENKLNCLLKQLGIENKRIKKIDDIESAVNTQIDYKKIRDIRARERQRSLEYLRDNI